jgi:mannose-6-phosphate isomerase class I
MIPAGTIHASGRNQVILEIGSLTVGSYTYKMYDYLRKDFDGNQRPIHTYHGDKVLDRSRTKEWVNQNLVNGGSRVVRYGEGWEEFVVGEHDLLYFSLRNLRFINRIEENTNGGFHVLTLVDGEQVLIRSKAHPEYSFIQNYLDIVVVPAAFGEYEIINLKPQTTIIEHKTMLKPKL